MKFDQIDKAMEGFVILSIAILVFMFLLKGCEYRSIVQCSTKNGGVTEERDFSHTPEACAKAIRGE